MASTMLLKYERSSGWVWTGGLEARQGVGTPDWGSPYTLKQNNEPSSNPTPRLGAQAGGRICSLR
jgi:hypothetical protein